MFDPVGLFAEFGEFKDSVVTTLYEFGHFGVFADFGEFNEDG